jgi:hypothetical protein
MNFIINKKSLEGKMVDLDNLILKIPKKRLLMKVILISLLTSTGEIYAQSTFDDSKVYPEEYTYDRLTINNFNNVSYLNKDYPSNKKFKFESVKVILIYSGSIILDAIGDGLNDSGEKGWGHFCNASSIGILLASPFIIDYDKSKWGWYLTSYVSLRIAFFDYTYNLTRGLPLEYVGGTSFWDKFLKELNSSSTLFARGGFFIIGVNIPINQFNPKKQQTR